MNHALNRRRFLAQSGKASLALGAASLLGPAATAFTGESALPRINFVQQPLPYAFSALEPVIDAQTMEIHFTKHAATYLKTLLEEMTKAGMNPKKTSLEQILGNVSKHPQKIRNNAGGHYNHELFWSLMRAPQANNRPGGELMTAIQAQFGGFDAFKEQFTKAAKDRFGSGWAWLVLDNKKMLKIGSTPNQDNPLMDISEIKGMPLLGLDVWEHAYYLKYQNKRADYIDNWFQVINWDAVAKAYKAGS